MVAIRPRAAASSRTGPTKVVRRSPSGASDGGRRRPGDGGAGGRARGPDEGDGRLGRWGPARRRRTAGRPRCASAATSVAANRCPSTPGIGPAEHDGAGATAEDRRIGALVLAARRPARPGRCRRGRRGGRGRRCAAARPGPRRVGGPPRLARASGSSPSSPSQPARPRRCASSSRLQRSVSHHSPIELGPGPVEGRHRAADLRRRGCPGWPARGARTPSSRPARSADSPRWTWQEIVPPRSPAGDSPGQQRDHGDHVERHVGGDAGTEATRPVRQVAGHGAEQDERGELEQLTVAEPEDDGGDQRWRRPGAAPACAARPGTGRGRRSLRRSAHPPPRSGRGGRPRPGPLARSVSFRAGPSRSEGCLPRRCSRGQ